MIPLVWLAFHMARAQPISAQPESPPSTAPGEPVTEPGRTSSDVDIDALLEAELNDRAGPSDDPDIPEGDVVSSGVGADRDQPMPWAVGVRPEEQDRARALFGEANRLVQIASVAAAVGKYKQALRYWDHPMIRYNLATVLTEMERLIEAYEHIVLALRHGEEPLGAANYKRAVRDHRALKARLVSVAIRCAHDGVQITLNDKSILDGPGQAGELIRPGEHKLVVKRGESTVAMSKYPFWPDRHYDIHVDPVRVTRRHWRRWIPWAVLGAGAGLSMAGGFLHWRAERNFDAFDDKIGQLCPDGCKPDMVPSDVDALENRAEIQNRSAGVLYVLGGGLATTGAVLLYFNRPRRIGRDAFEIRERPFDVRIAPVASARVLGITAGGTF